MYKLVSPIENSRWSFLDGFHIFNCDVTLLYKDDVKKYKLIDEDGNLININVEDCLEEYE